MFTFLFVYRAPTHYQPGSPDTMAKWNAWFEDLGSHVVSVGNPILAGSALGNCATDTALGGYSLITAEDIDEAIGLAEGCPFLSIGGGVEVGELTLLNPASVDTTIEDHARATQLAR
ncbi:MAG: YciI family protein [Solirubrobacteraceae bacterium]